MLFTGSCHNLPPFSYSALSPLPAPPSSRPSHSDSISPSPDPMHLHRDRRLGTSFMLPAFALNFIDRVSAVGTIRGDGSQDGFREGPLNGHRSGSENWGPNFLPRISEAMDLGSGVKDVLFTSRPTSGSSLLKFDLRGSY